MKKIITLMAALCSISIVAHADIAQNPSQKAPNPAPQAVGADNTQTPSDKTNQMTGSSGDEASTDNDKDPEADQ